MAYFVVSDAISESNPRIIDDTRARKLANDLKRCSYYETCATYGLNVERVFQDGKSIKAFNLHCCRHKGLILNQGSYIMFTVVFR